ncbi:MAG: hypothetical protein IJQ12_07775 [Lachnospiraceae bacterium]|nr:hypothetical protein [Lachnospiraceae bacterium]
MRRANVMRQVFILFFSALAIIIILPSCPPADNGGYINEEPAEPQDDYDIPTEIFL